MSTIKMQCCSLQTEQASISLSQIIYETATNYKKYGSLASKSSDTKTSEHQAENASDSSVIKDASVSDLNLEGLSDSSDFPTF